MTCKCKRHGQEKHSKGDDYCTCGKNEYPFRKHHSRDHDKKKPFYLWQSYSGYGNNVKKPYLGMANVALLRKTKNKHKCPRRVSNAICKKLADTPNKNCLTDMTWIWGQFLDHEITLTHTGDEKIHIDTSSDDPHEDFPDRKISFNNSVKVDCVYENLGKSHKEEQPNNISAFIDATNVYGFNQERALALRRLDGSGKLKMQKCGEYLMPFNECSLENVVHHPTDPTTLFLAGDIRANENVYLLAIHTLFVREHNRLCDEIRKEASHTFDTDEMIYQHARRIVIGLMQSITYNEFLPAILGKRLAPYKGYNKHVDPRIANEFSTAGYRIGHGMLSSVLKVGKKGTIRLQDVFFNPAYVKENGIDDLLLGATLKRMQDVNGQIVDDVRNNLFEKPSHSHLLDLATLNIQRGRDHNLAGYNDVREAYGLCKKKSFADITSNQHLVAKLGELYDSPDDIDLWIGCVIEDHIEGGAIGELCATILVEQFERLRDGDRFWYENNDAIGEKLKYEIHNTRLADIIDRNTGIYCLEENAFFLKKGKH
jgi:hypothetical protein